MEVFVGVDELLEGEVVYAEVAEAWGVYDVAAVWYFVELGGGGGVLA